MLGFAETLQHMTPGEVWEFWLEHAVAYGVDGRTFPTVDPGEYLHLHVHLVSVNRYQLPDPLDFNVPSVSA